MKLPKQLNKDGKALYKRLIPHVNEPSLLFAYCKAYQQFLQSTQDMEEQGMYQTSSKGWQAPSAPYMIQKHAISTMNQLAQRLGLDQKKELNMEDNKWEGLIERR